MDQTRAVLGIPALTMASETPEPSLRSWAEWFWGRLSREEQNALRVMPSLKVGTMCSGTDCCVPVLHALGTLGGFSIQHTFSCEIDPKKQAWIRGNWPQLKTIFADVGSLGSGFALNVVSGRKEPVPAVQWLVAGFVCKTVSAEHNSRAEFADCIRKGMGATGETFTALMRYVRRFGPSVVVLENVEGLLKRIRGSEPPFLGVKLAFEESGYSFGWRVLDPRSFFLPQRRGRVWMWALRGPDASRRCNAVPVTIANLHCNAKPLLDMLFSKVAQLSKEETSSCLTDRQWAVVEEVERLLREQRGPRAGELVDVIVDVTRSVERAVYCVGASPCLLPNSLPYRCLSGRVLSPLETMACQGLFVEDFGLLETWGLDPSKARLLRDLAGNSFTSSVCMSVLLACMAA